MKQLYKTNITIEIHLKNGNKDTTSSNKSDAYYKLRYGTLPSSMIKEMPIKDFNLYELNKYGHGLLIGNTGRCTNCADDRMFTEFKFGFRYCRYYHNEIEKLVIKEEYSEVNIDEVSIDQLQKDLGFRGYSELLFDRLEELAVKKERERFAELLKIRE